MASNQLRTWLAAGSRHDERFLDAQQVALFIADSGWISPRHEDAALNAVVRVDDRLSDGTVELREDGFYYLSTRTGMRDAGTPKVTVIDGATGECMSQAWIETTASVDLTLGPPIVEPFVAARPSGISDQSLGLD